MKVTRIHINSYRHLQDIKLDFVYPVGHKKEGEPLEKICLIGQSATGKTTILELIKKGISNLTLETINDKSFRENYNLQFNGLLECIDDENNYSLHNDVIFKNDKIFENIENSSGSIGTLLNSGLKLLYLNAELISSDALKLFSHNPLDIVNELSKDTYSNFRKRLDTSGYDYEFGKEINASVILSLFYNIVMYRRKFMQMASELISKGSIGDLKRLNKEVLRWNQQNENPLIPFAKTFNPILEKLNLEVDLVNTEYIIPIKSRWNDDVIPISGLSTGTKSLLFTFFPLYELNTSNSIIFLDEPERSLFPDMQFDLMDHYRMVAPEAQFIVATHSPFIAAGFEPEERFILQFNEKGDVVVYQGSSPIGDDPNDILRNDFNVDYYNAFGKNAYKEYLDLKRKVIDEKDTEKKKDLIKKMSVLGDKYNF